MHNRRSATIKQAISLFTEEFFEHPTIQEVNSLYRWNPANHPNISTDNEYDTGMIAVRYFIPRLNLIGNYIPNEVSDKCILFAKAFAEHGYGHCDWSSRPDAAVEVARLSSLLRTPSFIASESILPFMLELKDLKHCEPWSFEMWSDYDSQEGTKGYHIKNGFGIPQVQGFHRLILCDDLWTGQSRELRRVFFASVAQALRLLASERSLVKETLRPRIDLIVRNRKYGGCHEPWCNASFREEEMVVLKKMARTDATIREAIKTPDIILIDHSC